MKKEHTRQKPAAIIELKMLSHQEGQIIDVKCEKSQ